jgi:tetratricopeptide (TPR) repeat protein
LTLLRNADLQTGHLERALARYAEAYPDLLDAESAAVNQANWYIALDLALILQEAGDRRRADMLLDQIEKVILKFPRMGAAYGYGIADAQIHALRGDKGMALAALRDAAKAGWRGPDWRYYRDFDPNLASIRNDREFKAVFADIERDMARQRAELAKRPKDAPLPLGDAGS